MIYMNIQHDLTVSLIGVDFIRYDCPMFTTLWKNLSQDKSRGRKRQHVADTHEHLQRDHLQIASNEKLAEYSQISWDLPANGTRI